AYINGGVAGRIVDKDGQSFNWIFLHLASDGKSVYGHSTGLNGGFAVSGVPPGNYILYIELQGSDHKSNKKWDYPGTFERAEAAVIEVGLAEKVEGLEFPLPGEYKVSTIEGQVTWEDGQPAANVEVMLLCPRSAKQDGFVVEFGPPTVRTDDLGRFQMEGFTNEVYWIEARGSKKDAKKDAMVEVHSQSRRIAPTEGLRGIKLVLSEKGFSGGCGK